MNIKSEKRTGHIFSDSPGHIQFVEHSANEMNAEKAFYERIEQFLRSSVELIAPGAGQALGEYERAGVQTTLGTAAASTVTTASGTGILMYSDDLALRLVARNQYKVPSFWSQTLLQDLRDKGLISQGDYHLAVVRLIQFGFHFVSVNQPDLVWAIRDSDWTPSPGVAKVLGTLAGPDCKLGDAVNVALDVLHEIWATPVSHAAKIALLDLMIQVLVTGRDGTAVLRVLNNRNATRSRIWTNATGEIQQSIRLWFVARRRGRLSTKNDALQ